MSVVGYALRPNHLRRFWEVTRTEGLGRALGKARRHLGVLGAPAPPPVPRMPRLGLWDGLARGGAFHAAAAPALVFRRRKIAVIGDLNLPQCRKYRVEQLAELWATAGVEVDFAHVEDQPRAMAILQDATHLILYRLARSDRVSALLYEARRLKVPILYDIDDPLFSLPALAGHGALTALGPGRRAHHLAEAPFYHEVMAAAEAVSVATPGLVQEARAFTRAPVWLRRNFADRETLEHGARAASCGPGADGVTLALASGSEGREADLEVLGAGLETFLAGGADRRLLLIGRWPENVAAGQARGRVRRLGMLDYATYLAALALADLVAVPLADDPFNACKSAARAIDAAAVGRAVAVSDVGDAAAVVADGCTGRVLAPGADWGAALEDLASDPGRSAAMGRAARRHLEAEWSARAALPVLSPELYDWVAG